MSRACGLFNGALTVVSVTMWYIRGIKAKLFRQVNWQKNTYRLPMLRSMFLVAGLLLLFNRLPPTPYVNSGFPIFRYARRAAVARDARTTIAALGSHRALPSSAPDKRCDVDGSCVIVPSNWSLFHYISIIAEHFAALPEKLSSLHLSALTLRGPPRFLS